jgi:hypothetical protein
LTPQQRRQKPRARIVRVALGAMVVAIIAGAVIVAGAASNAGPVTTADAVQKLVTKIESGPKWETAKISNAVAGYLKGKSTGQGHDGAVSCKSLLERGPNVGCGGCLYVNGRNPTGGFACYLQASASNGYESSYFSESASGGNIRPISTAKFGKY